MSIGEISAEEYRLMVQDAADDNLLELIDNAEMSNGATKDADFQSMFGAPLHNPSLVTQCLEEIREAHKSDQTLEQNEPVQEAEYTSTPLPWTPS